MEGETDVTEPVTVGQLLDVINASNNSLNTTELNNGLNVITMQNDDGITVNASSSEPDYSSTGRYLSTTIDMDSYEVVIWCAGYCSGSSWVSASNAGILASTSNLLLLIRFDKKDLRLTWTSSSIKMTYDITASVYFKVLDHGYIKINENDIYGEATWGTKHI